MRFLLDENFPRTALQQLQLAGHEVIDIRDTELKGSNDSIIFEHAQTIGACLLTTDRDFFHTIPHLYSAHCGIVVIALRKPNRASILSKLEWLLSKVLEQQMPNRVIQLRDKHWTVYPPLDLHP